MSCSGEPFEKIERRTLCEIEGTIVNAPTVNKRILRVRPTEHHYEADPGAFYIKYGCPVCDGLGNRHSVYEGEASCPLCGIHLEWEKADMY